MLDGYEQRFMRDGLICLGPRHTVHASVGNPSRLPLVITTVVGEPGVTVHRRPRAHINEIVAIAGFASIQVVQSDRVAELVAEQWVIERYCERHQVPVRKEL